MSRVQKRSCYVLKHIQYNLGNFIEIAYSGNSMPPPPLIKVGTRRPWLPALCCSLLSGLFAGLLLQTLYCCIVPVYFATLSPLRHPLHVSRVYMYIELCYIFPLCISTDYSVWQVSGGLPWQSCHGNLLLLLPSSRIPTMGLLYCSLFCQADCLRLIFPVYR